MSLFPDPIEESGSHARKKREEWVIAHCDGGARGNPGPSGFGATLQDEHGRTLAELSEFLGNHTNNYAEYSGLLGCLQWALDHRVSHLRVVSDSELMVKQIQGRYKVNSPDLKPMWEEAKRRIRQLAGFEINHALRHKNKDADRLANEAMDRGMGRAYPRNSVSAGSERATPAKPALRPAAGIAKPAQPQMLRGFVRDGVVHLLGEQMLPDGIFVKIIPE